MKNISFGLLLALLSTSVAYAVETGTANQVMRIPPAGGIGKYGKVNLASPAAVVSPLPTLNGAMGIDMSGSTGVLTVNSGTGSVQATLPQAKGGFGADVSGSTGIALNTAGTFSWLSSSGSGNVCRVTGPTISSLTTTGTHTTATTETTGPTTIGSIASGAATSSNTSVLTLAGINYQNSSDGNGGMLRFYTSSQRSGSDRRWAVANNQHVGGSLAFYVSSSNTTDPVINSATPDVPKFWLDSGGTPTFTTQVANIQAPAVNNAIYYQIKNSAGTPRAFMGFGGSGNSKMSIDNSENGELTLNTNATERLRIQADGTIRFVAVSASTVPTNAASAMGYYQTGNKFVIWYNDAGTVRYKYLDMSGTGVTWVHTTTAP